MLKAAATISAALVLLMMGPHWADGVARTVAGLPSLVFAPLGTAQQLAVLWEAMRRRVA